MITKNIKMGSFPEGFYEISEYGDVYRIKNHKKMSACNDRDGYKKIALTNGNTHKRSYFRIAYLVAMMFIGNPPKSMIDPTVDHIDGDKTNNHFTNLRWIERSINSSIRQNRGIGEANHEAKLTGKDVKEICELLKRGDLSLRQIAEMYSVKKSTINNIKRHKTWKHITDGMELGSTGV